jgi:hypothetical protein
MEEIDLYEDMEYVPKSETNSENLKPIQEMKRGKTNVIKR